jgi:site-specific recombinase XerD
MHELQPISPKEALDWYLQEREPEVAESTLKAHNYRLSHFLRWCDEVNLDNLNDLTGRDLQRFRMWRREDGDLNNVSLVTQLSTLRVFIKWCERVDAVEEGLHDKILLPSLSRNEDRREVLLRREAAQQLLGYLRQTEMNESSVSDTGLRRERA